MGEGIIEDELNPFREMVAFSHEKYDFFADVTFSAGDIISLSTADKQKIVDSLLKYKPEDTEISIERSECGNQECDCIVIKPGMSGIIRIYLFSIAEDKRRKKRRHCAIFDFQNIEYLRNMSVFSSYSVSYYESGNMRIAPDILSMMVLCMNFDDFYKYYKLKSLKTKSIKALIYKYIVPINKNTTVDFGESDFIILSIASDNVTVYRRKCPYENFADSIKDFAQTLKEKL